VFAVFASIRTIIRARRSGSRSERSRRARLAEDDGFLLLETLIAAVFLVVGLMGAFALLDLSAETMAATRAREGGVNLAREILEDAGTIPFSELSPSIKDKLQQMPALAPKPPGPAWQIERRGYTYTITVEECSVDDPKDGLGKHDSTFCPGQTEGTADAIPVDLKRVTAKVSYFARGRTHEVREAETFGSAGEQLGLSATELKLASTEAVTTIEKPTEPTITSASVTKLTFSVTAPAGTTAIDWSLDGLVQSTPVAVKSGTTQWTFSWTISGFSDGTYQIGAQAEQANGVVGQAVTIPVKLIRSVPAAPSGVTGGFNSIYVSSEATKTQVAELQWQANTEPNVIGYRVYNPSGKEVCPGSPSTLSLEVSCVDLSPPPMTASNLTYSVVALYRNSSGVVTESPATTVTLVGATSKKYTAANSNGNTGTNCEKNTKKDMLLSSSPGSDTTFAASISFCSDAFPAGETVIFGGTLTAYFSNESTEACTITGELTMNGSIHGPAAVPKSISANSATPKAYEFTFANTGLFEPGTGGRIEVLLFWTGCNAKTKIHYGSSTYPTSFQTAPKPLSEAPQAPPSLTVKTQSDGTAILEWTAPSGGPAVAFYRIYRDGKLYTNRYDTANATETEDVDTNRNSAHTYYITAVSSSMAESEFRGPVTG
jgi:hypothetical protein